MISFLLLLSGSLTGQRSYDQTIMTYNILDYRGDNPNDNAREDDMRAVIHHVSPDILVVEEIHNKRGYDHFLDDVLNYGEPGRYEGAPFYDQVGTDFDIALFYNPEVFDSVSTSVVDITSRPGLRDAVEFAVRHKETATVVRLYGVHLKAGNPYFDPASAQEREAECSTLREYLNTLSPDSHFLVLGDFNFYRSSEGGFQRLTESQDDNDGRLFDPVERIGDWHDTRAFVDVHTQSTRGGSFGGMDDRFDFILASNGVVNSTNINSVSSSYTAFGNDGRHLNQAINEGENTAVSQAMANALVEASDHLPVFMALRFVSRDEISVTEGQNLVPPAFELHPNFPNPFNSATFIPYEAPEGADLTISVNDLLGRRIKLLVEGIGGPGMESVVWDGTDERGRAVGTGIYFCRISIQESFQGSSTRVRKMILLR